MYEGERFIGINYYFCLFVVCLSNFFSGFAILCSYSTLLLHCKVYHKVLCCEMPYDFHNSALEREHITRGPKRSVELQSMDDGNKIIIKVVPSYWLSIYLSRRSHKLSQRQMQFILEQKPLSSLDRSPCTWLKAILALLGGGYCLSTD